MEGFDQDIEKKIYSKLFKTLDEIFEEYDYSKLDVKWRGGCALNIIKQFCELSLREDSSGEHDPHNIMADLDVMLVGMVDMYQNTDKINEEIGLDKIDNQSSSVSDSAFAPVSTTSSVSVDDDM